MHANLPSIRGKPFFKRFCYIGIAIKVYWLTISLIITKFLQHEHLLSIAISQNKYGQFPLDSSMGRRRFNQYPSHSNSKHS